jgi:ATP-dependent protease HslVU (ClpYQ) peptidase subunit
MTVVLAWADGERVVMAGDQQVTSEDHDRSWITSKINRLTVPSRTRQGRKPVDEQMLIGTAGSLTATSLARHALEPGPAPDARTGAEPVQWWIDVDLERWAWRTGVELDRLMREHGQVTRDSDNNESIDYDAIIGFRGHVFEVGNSSVVTGRAIAGGRLGGAGNGSAYALGAAHALITSGYEPVDALKRAVEIACDHNPLCGGGIDVQELC